MDKRTFGRITPGSIAQFDLVFTSNGMPFNFTTFTSGKLVFQNKAGTKTEITLSVPGSNPGSGILRATLSATDTAGADDLWRNADVVLVRSGTDTFVIPLAGKFEIVKRYVVG